MAEKESPFAETGEWSSSKVRHSSQPFHRKSHTALRRWLVHAAGKDRMWARYQALKRAKDSKVAALWHSMGVAGSPLHQDSLHTDSNQVPGGGDTGGKRGHDHDTEDLGLIHHLQPLQQEVTAAGPGAQAQHYHLFLQLRMVPETAS
jgi:hypothetical protein